MKWHPVMAKFIPNPTVTYRVRNGLIETVGILGTSMGCVPLRGASFSVSGGGFLQLGVGNITISGRNSEQLLWENVPNVHRVRDILINLAADVNEYKSASPALKWYEGLTENDLEDFVIVIPKIPEPLYDVLNDISYIPVPGIKYFKYSGEGILEGEEIAQLNQRASGMTKILNKRGFDQRWFFPAPVSGKILICNDHAAGFCTWNKETNSPNWISNIGIDVNGSSNLSEENIARIVNSSLFVIQPLKGRFNANAIRDVYSNYISMAKYLLEDIELRNELSTRSYHNNNYNHDSAILHLEYIRSLEISTIITIPIAGYRSVTNSKPEELWRGL